MIRPVLPTDAGAIIDMCYECRAESPTYASVADDPEYVRENLERMTVSPYFIGYIDDEYRGVILGGAGPTWYDARIKAAEEFLFVSPEFRGTMLAPRLVKAFEAEAVRRGAHKMFMGVSTGVTYDRTVALYLRLGFQWDGHNLVKKFDV